MLKTNCLKLAENILVLLIAFLFVGAFSSTVLAATNNIINFQGKIVRNDTGYEGLNVTTGNPACVVAGASNDTCDFRIRYYSASSGGTLLLTETFSDKEIGAYNGAFDLSLGSTTPTAGSYATFDAMIKGEDTIYVELGFAPAGAGSFTETFSRMPLGASAYAIKAKYASGANTAFQFDTAVNGTGYSTPTEGMVFYDSDDDVLMVYNGSSWEAVGGSGTGSLFTDGGIFTYLTELADHFVLGSSSYTAIGSDSYATYDAGLASRPTFSLDMTAERLTLSGSSVRSGLTVYSDYNSTGAWPVASFKADGSSFSNVVLDVTQDGTGDLVKFNKGSTNVFAFENALTFYIKQRPDAPATVVDRLYNINGALYWNGSALGSGSPLWTDGGTFTYLTSTSDDVIIGGDSAGTAKFFFDVSTGNLGIGTSTPGAKLDIAGASSVISNTTGDITITPDDTVVIKANDTQNDNLMEWQNSSGTILSLINQSGYAVFGKSTANAGAMLTLGANTSSVAQINLNSSVGTDVSAPTSGDLWWNGTNLYFYDGSDNIDLLAGGGGSLYTDDDSVVSGGYLNVAHDDDTYSVLADGWVCVGGSDNSSCTGGNWKNIKDTNVTIGHYLSNEWNKAAPEGIIRTQTRLTDVELAPGIDVGTGADGSITVSSNTNINTTSLISGRSCSDGGDAVNYNITAFNAGGTSATLSTTPSTGCLSAGDEILIINLQGTSSAYPNVGNYETLEVLSVSGTTVTFKTSKINFYGDTSTGDTNLGTGTGNQRVMLQRVPNYIDVTVNSSMTFSPTAWNNVKGGVMFFRSNGTVSVAGTISTAGLGYVGGAGGLVNLYGVRGGTFSYDASTTRTAYITGGGAGEDGGNYGYYEAGGGGGGSLSTAGTDGGRYGTGGYGGYGATTVYTAAIGKLYFGGAGGGGGGGSTGGYGGAGGNGGGIIAISGNSISVSGYINSSGNVGSAYNNGSYGGGGGGGAGGSVALFGNSLTLGTSRVLSSAGAGGDGAGTADGGAGGSGLVSIYYSSSVTGTSSPTFSSALIGYNSYGIYNSPVIATPSAQSYDNLRWTQTLDTYGKVSVQTRSGAQSVRDYGLDFDGDGDYLQMSSNYNYTTQAFTISMWINPTLEKESIIMSNGQWQVSGYYASLSATGSIAFYTNQSGTIQYSSTAISSITPNEWQFISIVRNGATVTIYRNGVDITGTHGTHTNPTTTALPFTVGSYSPGLSSWYYPGYIDDVQVWSTNLNTTQITDSMNNNLVGNETNLAGYWKLNEMTGSVAQDYTSGDKDLTIYNASWRQLIDWESWKPFTSTTNYAMLQNSDTHTDWTGTNATVAEGDVTRNIDFFEDEDEPTVTNVTKITSSTAGGYAGATISSTDLSGYDYVTAWVRASQTGNTLRIGMGESAATEQYEDITVDGAGVWQKVYWDLSDIAAASRNGITKLRITNQTAVSNTIYIDNVRAEKLTTDNEGTAIASTPNDYLQYRVIFTTTNLAYYPRLENISVSYNTGYRIVIYDNNNVRLYNLTDSTQYLKLDVATTGTSGGGGGGFDDGIAISAVADGVGATAFTLKTSTTYSNPSSKLLSVMNNTEEKMYLDAQGNLYVSGTITSGKGFGIALVNNTGGTVAAKSLVVVDASENNSFTTTTIQGADGVFGVVQGVDINNDTNHDGNCDNGDKCIVVIEGLVDVKIDNAATSSKGDYVYSSTTAGKGHAIVSSTQADGLVGVVSSTANAGSGYVSMIFSAQNKAGTDIYLNTGFDKNAYRDMYTLLAKEYTDMTLAERRGIIESGQSEAIMFDNYVDGLKVDAANTTTALDYYNQKMGLWGGLSLTDATTDITSNRYFGASGASLISQAYYYDRAQTGKVGQDSTIATQINTGIDPTWYKGVRYVTTCTSNCASTTNLSESYNGGLVTVSGAYATSSEHGYIDITVVSQTPTGIVADIATSDSSCTVNDASLPFGQDYELTAGSCSGSSIKINPARHNYVADDVFRVASWYVEPTTADDRGSKREFPERSIIIPTKTASNIYLTIVDYDTQRVWMKFNSNSAVVGSANILVNNASYNFTDTFMINGDMYVDFSGVTSNVDAVVVGFARDDAWALNISTWYKFGTNIGNRNVGSGYTTTTNPYTFSSGDGSGASFVGLDYDVFSSSQIQGFDSDGEDTSGTYYSNTVTFAQDSNKAYMWLKGYIDPSDSSGDITVSVSNDGGSTYIPGILVRTNTSGELPEYEYSFNFTTSNNEYKVKIELTRDSSKKTAVYVTDWGLAQMNIQGGTTSGIFTEQATGVTNGGYVELVHGQNTYNIVATGWYYETGLSKWREVDTTSYQIRIIDADTVRLYNNSGGAKDIRLDVAIGVEMEIPSFLKIAPSLAQVDSGNATNSIWLNKLIDSGNLLKLQTNGSDMMVVDSSGNLTLGGGSAGNVTLTLGSGEGYQGAIRYNASTDRIEFYMDGGWIVLGDYVRRVTLSAEYPGAVLSADGTANTGAMVSDNTGTTSNSMNYYEWNSSETSLNDYDIRVRFTLPSDFSSWGGGTVVFNFATEATGTTNNKADFYIYKEGSATIDGSSTAQSSSSAGVWKTATIVGSGLDECTGAETTCMFVIRGYSANDSYVRIGDIDISYNRSL